MAANSSLTPTLQEVNNLTNIPPARLGLPPRLLQPHELTRHLRIVR